MVSVKIVFGDSRSMREVGGEVVDLIVTSPPYFNAPFDFPGLYNTYDEYLSLLRGVFSEMARVLKHGRHACIVAQDVRIDGKLYPIVADIINIMRNVGFEYQEKIIWTKHPGYVRISRRSGIMVQHPYPLYYYPDNIYEEILVFKKPGEFDKQAIPHEVLEKSRIDLHRFQSEKWYLSIWEITSVLPQSKWSKYSAPFPEALVERLVRLYSYYGDTVLDPFLGTGTTCLIAERLGRNCIGYEVDVELKKVVEERLCLKSKKIVDDGSVEVIVRDDVVKLMSKIRGVIDEKLAEKKKREWKRRGGRSRSLVELLEPKSL